MSENTPNFSIKSIFDEAIQEFGSPDRGFFRTTRLMLTAPGHTLRKILNGEERNVTSPFRYFLLAYTLFAIVFLASGASDIAIADQVAFYKQQYAASSNSRIAGMNESELREMMGLAFYAQYPLVSTLISLVFLWLASLLALIRFPLAPGQRLTATLYLFGATTFIQLPLVALVFLHMPFWMSAVASLIVLIYLTWAAQTFDRSKFRFGFVRGLLWFVIWNFLIFLLSLGFTMKTGLEAGYKQAMEEKRQVEKSTK